MVLYGLYLLSFLFLHSLTNNIGGKEIHSIKKQCVGCFLLLFVFYGFREISILNDTAHYYDHFSNLISVSSFDYQKIWEFNIYDRFEAGYLIFENIVGKIWRNPYAIIMISSFIITVTWIYLVKKHVHDVAFCFFLIVIFGLMNTHYSGIRQGLAVCIFFLSYQLFLTKDKTKYYLAGCLFAFFFHSSAIVLFLVPLLKKIQINRMSLLLIICGTIIVSIFLNYLFDISGLNESIYFEQAQERTTLPIANLITLIFFSSIMLLSKDTLVNKTKEAEMLWWFSILNLVFRFFAIFIGIIGRYTNYFAVFTIILFVNSIASERKISIKKMLIIVLAFIYVFITLIYRPEWTHIIPYSFYDFSSNYHETDLGY